jgi:hypothetical protein
MYRKRTLYLIALFLLVESAAIVLVPSRLPRPARAITAGINVIAGLGLIVLARQQKE